MRTIINISLPKELNRVVEKAMRRGKFATKSEFFRNLLRLWEEGKLVGELEESRKELKAGKDKRLRSLVDLSIKNYQLLLKNALKPPKKYSERPRFIQN